MGKFAVLPETVKVKTREEAEAAIATLRGPRHRPNRVIAIDTETTGLSRQKDFAVIISLSSGHNRFTVWPEAFPYFRDYIEDPELKLIMWNANFDVWMLRNVGIDVYRHCARTQYRVLDAMVMHALAYDDRPHTLKFAAREYHGIQMVEFKAVFGKEMRTRALHDILLDPKNEDVVGNYAGLDAYATLLMFIALRKELLAADTGVEEYPTLWNYFLETEVPYTRVLFECEKNGIRLNKDRLLEMAPGIDRQLIRILRWFARQTGRVDINLNSNPQMIKLFFDDLKYTPPSFTDKGSPQVAKKWLERIAADGCPYAVRLLDYRDLKKKSGTYIKGLLKLVANDGKLHTSFNQTGARTGRLSSSEPNLQNQPVYIRDAYTADEGYRLFARDYSQLEMRILAHFSGDKVLIDAIRRGDDVHSTCASMMFKIPYTDIIAARKREDSIDELEKAGKEFKPLTEYETLCLKSRKAAKAINFGLVYGMGAQKLSRELRVKLEVAKDYIQTYFKTFPGIKKHFYREIDKAHRTGTCGTILGRQRQVPGIWSAVHGDVSAAERKIKNTPIQGTAADIAKMAMIKIYEDDLIHACGYKMQLNVHDEIVGSVPEEFVKDVLFNERFRSLMEHPLPYELAVPLETTGKYGKTWAQTK